MKKLDHIKNYPCFVEIHTTEGEILNYVIDGLERNFWTREEFADDGVISEFDKESQNKILDAIDNHFNGGFFAETITFTQSDLLNAVATFNADPYCVENEEQAAEIMSEIEENGVTVVTDKEEREIALAKLDLPSDSPRTVYCAGGCLFSIDV